MACGRDAMDDGVTLPAARAQATGAIRRLPHQDGSACDRGPSGSPHRHSHRPVPEAFCVGLTSKEHYRMGTFIGGQIGPTAGRRPNRGAASRTDRSNPRHALRIGARARPARGSNNAPSAHHGRHKVRSRLVVGTNLRGVARNCFFPASARCDPLYDTGSRTRLRPPASRKLIDAGPAGNG